MYALASVYVCVAFLLLLLLPLLFFGVFVLFVSSIITLCGLSLRCKEKNEKTKHTDFTQRQGDSEREGACCDVLACTLLLLLLLFLLL